MPELLPGRATPEGTARFAARSGAAAGHFRRVLGLELSSIGVGTYLGDPTDEVDRRYEEAIAVALASGGNVLDTAINYRCQRSERAVGRAIATAVAGGELRRDEIFVSTKGGFLAFDGAVPADPRRWFREGYLASGLVVPEEVVAGCHVLSPRFQLDQVERSRRNLGLATIDLYYLHNPETQLEAVDETEFERRLLDVFEALECAADDGKIAAYGFATWQGLRVAQDGRLLSLERAARLAEKAGGPGNRFRAVQLPLNIAMPEAFVSPVQEVGGEEATPLEAARRLGLATFASASMAQGRILKGLPPFVAEVLPGLASPAQRALQFTRSTPGLDVALVGCGRGAHARENFGLAKIPPAAREQILKFFEAG